MQYSQQAFTCECPLLTRGTEGTSTPYYFQLKEIFFNVVCSGCSFLELKGQAPLLLCGGAGIGEGFLHTNGSSLQSAEDPSDLILHQKCSVIKLSSFSCSLLTLSLLPHPFSFLTPSPTGFPILYLFFGQSISDFLALLTYFPIFFIYFVTTLELQDYLFTEQLCVYEVPGTCTCKADTAAFSLETCLHKIIHLQYSVHITISFHDYDY